MYTVEALDRLILFRQKPDSLLRRLMATEEAVRVAAQGELVALAVENGWQGDLWRCCIARELVSSENPFSLVWERRSGGQDTLKALALADMKLFFELVSAPPEGGAWPLLRDFRHESRRTADCASFMAFSGKLAAAGSPEGLLDRLTAFYQTQGVGLLGIGQVFRARRTGNGAELVPVEDRPPVRLADLVGYRQQKDLLIRNTEAFLRGKGSNNVLLYGDAGTGKSTSIQALVNEYADQGLRLIELYKEQYDLIPDILRQVKGRNYRFLLFLDDLSFEENETSYKYLKAVMEGGAEAPPDLRHLQPPPSGAGGVERPWRYGAQRRHSPLRHRRGKAVSGQPLRPADLLPGSHLRGIPADRLRTFRKGGDGPFTGTAPGRSRHMAGPQRQPFRTDGPAVRGPAGALN